VKIQNLIIIVIVIILLMYGSAYVVDETEQVIITQFGEYVGDAKKEPGLYLKIDFI
jgi:membrane protease subunit HflC